MRKIMMLCLALVLCSTFCQTVTANAEMTTVNYYVGTAGVYGVWSDVPVTLVSELGTTVEVVENDMYSDSPICLLAGNNKIATSNANASISFLPTFNDISYEAEWLVIETEPIIYGQEDTVFQNLGMELLPGESYSFTYSPSQGKSGLVYPYILMEDTNESVLCITSDTGFYADILKPAGSQPALCWSDAERTDIELLYVREGENTITIENIGANSVKLKDISINSAGELMDNDDWSSQLSVKSLKLTRVWEDMFFIGWNSDVNFDSATFYGKVRADMRDEKYGVKVNGKYFYGAKPGDTVSDGNGGTTTFTFGSWDGSFEIHLENILEKGTQGWKSYRFFLGNEYSDVEYFPIGNVE